MCGSELSYYWVRLRIEAEQETYHYLKQLLFGFFMDPWEQTCEIWIKLRIVIPERMSLKIMFAKRQSFCFRFNVSSRGNIIFWVLCIVLWTWLFQKICEYQEQICPKNSLDCALLRNPVHYHFRLSPPWYHIFGICIHESKRDTALALDVGYIWVRLRVDNNKLSVKIRL